MSTRYDVPYQLELPQRSTRSARVPASLTLAGRFVLAGLVVAAAVTAGLVIEPGPVDMAHALTACVLLIIQLGLGDTVLQRYPRATWRAALTDVMPTLPTGIAVWVAGERGYWWLTAAGTALIVLWMVCIIARHTAIHGEHASREVFQR